MSPTYVPRRGDSRPVDKHPPQLNWRPAAPVRWLPRHGVPWCVIEWISQKVILSSARLPIYITIVTALTVIAILWFGI